LKCADLRLGQGQLAIRRAFGWSERELYVTRSKSGLERVIELDAATVKFVRSHLRREDLKESSDDWIFTNRDSDRLSPTSVSKRFGVLLDRADVPRIRLHDLRHTHASHLILSGPT